MQSSVISVKGALIFAALCCLSLGSLGQAQVGEVKVPFLFSDDEQFAQTELEKVIPRSQELRSDPYLKAPMTRMEYMLSRLEAELDTSREVIREQLSESFDFPTKGSVTPRSIKGFARYSPETGHIVVGYKIQQSGRPTRPIRATCDEVLTHLASSIPQTNTGYIMHNTALGVLAQEDLDRYTPIMATLAKNIVHRIVLQVEESNTMYGLACQRVGNTAPVQYHRYSFQQ
ncbi:MAG: hypothetical protein QM706_14290 [Nitrospira sp.]